MVIATLVVDTRERNGASPHLKELIETYNAGPGAKKGNRLEMAIQQINVGDYVVSIDGRILLIIERKTWHDLAASILDGRMEAQQGKMEATGVRHLYMIEGAPWHEDESVIGHMKAANLLAKLRHNLLRGRGFIQTRDPMHSAKTVLQLALDVIAMHWELELTEQSYLKELRELQRRYAGSATASGLWQQVNETLEFLADKAPDGELKQHGAASEKASESESNAKPQESEQGEAPKGQDGVEVPAVTSGAAEVVEQRNAQQLAFDTAVEKMWRILPGVGMLVPVLAATMPFLAFSTSPTSYLSQLANTTYPSGVRLGPKRAQKIIDSASTLETQCAWLACLQINAAMAAVILQHHSWADLAQGAVQARDLARLPYTVGKRKFLGPAAAAKVVEFFAAASRPHMPSELSSLEPS